MLIRQSRQILIFLIIFTNFLLSQDCVSLNPDEYGECTSLIGFVWTGENCQSVNGCDMGGDAEYFFNLIFSIAHMNSL